MAYRLNPKVDIAALSGKSGKFVHTGTHLIFEGRDGSSIVLLSQVQERTKKASNPVVTPHGDPNGALSTDRNLMHTTE